jgi:4-hydroxybenzoate polyprenyltransferase
VSETGEAVRLVVIVVVTFMVVAAAMTMIVTADRDEDARAQRGKK